MLFKIRNSNNLFKDFSAISLAYTYQICDYLQLSQWKTNLKMQFTYQKRVPIQRFCKKFRINLVLVEIWSIYYQLSCSFAPLSNLDVQRNLMEIKFSLPISLFHFFRLERSSLRQTTKVFLAFTKRIVAVSITSATFTVDWLANFLRWAIFDWFVSN